jgi:glycosyltransferase involved in cell wall biosynthesis
MDRRPLRILYHNRIAASDGMQVHVNEIVTALRKQGHVVRVVGPGAVDGNAQAAGEAGALERLAETLRRLLPPAAYELAELAYNIPAYLRLAREVKQFKPDVIYERYNLFLLAGLALHKRRKLPLILEVNSPLATERAEFGNLQLVPLARRCETALWTGADIALPVTGVLAQQVVARRGTAKGVHVMHNGANLAHRPDPQVAEEVRRRLGLGEDAIVLGFVGFIRAWHGVGWAIDALASLPANVVLLVVGDGPARVDLTARAAELGLADRVRFVGRMPHEQIPELMQSFDVALQTAAVGYASPLKLFEYMGLARAIVAPDQPNIREVLTDGHDAALFTPDDEASFRLALERLCTDASLRARLGANALKTVLEHPFTWDSNASRIASFAHQLIEDRCGSAA